MSPKSEKEFNREISEKGWVLFPEAVDLDLIDSMVVELNNDYLELRKMQDKAGIGGKTEGTVHHVLKRTGSHFRFLEQAVLSNYIRAYFGGVYILNSFGGVIARRSESSYAARMHRDVRTYLKDARLMLNMLVMMSDFTLENGATYLLSGSHLVPQRPNVDEFLKKAERAIGKKGSIVLFDSNLWHAAGENKTDTARPAVTLTFSRPFVKPQFDYTRFIGYDVVSGFSNELKQVLGYFARVPATHEEWYRTPEDRFYRSDQEEAPNSY